MTDPHYVRFARALVLASSISGAGCAASTIPDDGATTADGGSGVDAYVDCTACQCATLPVDSGLPACPPTQCCPVLGPLSPPDLPALA